MLYDPASDSTTPLIGKMPQWNEIYHSDIKPDNGSCRSSRIVEFSTNECDRVSGRKRHVSFLDPHLQGIEVPTILRLWVNTVLTKCLDGRFWVSSGLPRTFQQSPTRLQRNDAKQWVSTLVPPSRCTSPSGGLFYGGFFVITESRSTSQIAGTTTIGKTLQWLADLAPLPTYGLWVRNTRSPIVHLTQSTLRLSIVIHWRHPPTE